MIHLFERLGLKLALDVGSGAVHVLDGAAYALLGAVGEAELREGRLPENTRVEDIKRIYDETELKSAFAELAALLREGLLFADDSYSEFSDILGAAPVKALCLHVAHDCNLRCKYCFAGTGGFGGGRSLMPPEVAKKAIDLLVRLSEGRRNLEVDFFGGEPLLNYEVVRETVAYARSLEKAHGKQFRFTITTNGLLLNDTIIADINRDMGNVVLSIDGRREVNDAMRPLAGGGGSYRHILPRYQKLVAARGAGEYYVRGTYTRNNLDFDADVLALYEAGFEQISVEPVVGDESDDYAIREEDLAAIEAAYTRLAKTLIERRRARQGDFNFFHFMLDLENGPCAIKRLRGCGAGNEYLAVTPEGELYPCHQFVGKPQFCMGNVDDGITLPEMKARFASANLLNKPDCQACWAKFFCSGGCNANNQSFCGDLCAPHQLSCKLEQMRLECAIAIKAALA